MGDYTEHLISMAGGDGPSGMAEVLAAHTELAWNHKTGQAICADCDAELGPFTADIEEQGRWHRTHQAAMLAAAGFGRKP